MYRKDFLGMSIAVSLLILRAVVGLVLAAHGAQNFFGWFDGPGFGKTREMLQSQGFRLAWLWALLGGLGEFGGGLLLALGLLSPLGALGVFAGMLMAVVIKLSWGRGFWSTKDGYEYPLVLALMSLISGIAGPGSYSLDALLGIRVPQFFFWIGLVLAVVVDVVGVITNHPRTGTPDQLEQRLLGHERRL
jgi:putative oxidoreductase